MSERDQAPSPGPAQVRRRTLRGRARAERRSPSLSRAARAFRAGHAAIAAVELAGLGYVWTCALTGRRDRVLHAAIGVLAAEGAGLVVGRGNCPLGPFQRRLGDSVPLFELVLSPVWAKRAVPILAGVSAVGIVLALRDPSDRPP